MLKHIVMWKIKEEFKSEEKLIKENIKNSLENLAKDLGNIKLQVIIDVLNTSTHDLILISEAKSKEDLQAYAKNEKHIEIINNYILPYTQGRSCIDYEV